MKRNTVQLGAGLALLGLTQGCVLSGRSQSSPSGREVRIGTLTEAQAVGLASVRLRAATGANVNALQAEAVVGERCWLVTFRDHTAAPDAWYLVVVYGPDKVIVSAY